MCITSNLVFRRLLQNSIYHGYLHLGITNRVIRLSEWPIHGIDKVMIP
jgi:hypothetical protein